MIHHRDIAVAVKLALEGLFDGRTVNICDEAPASMYELAQLAGKSLEPSPLPLENPWHLLVDHSLARSLGFQPSVRTIYQAVQDKLL